MGMTFMEGDLAIYIRITVMSYSVVRILLL